MQLRMTTALAKGPSGKTLGRNVAEEARKKMADAEPGLALLYLSSRLALQETLAGVRETLGDVPLIGCTTAGEFTESAVDKESAALALFSRTPDYRFHVTLAEGLKDDPTGCVQKAVDAVPARDAVFPHRGAVLLHDGLAGRGEEAVMSATAILGPDVHFSGGAAADDLAFEKTHILFNDRVVTDAVALAVIDSKKPLAYGVKHGHSPVTEELTVTKAKDTVLYEVNGEPAWDVWIRLLADEAKSVGIDVTQLKDASSVGQFLLRYELGLATDQGEYKVRIPLSKNEDGSLNFACTIFEGAKFRIMKSPKEDQIRSAETSAKLAKEKMGGHAIAGALVFDCVCRGLILGDDFYKGVDAVKRIIGDVPLIGFETYGEICRRTGQLSGLHNTTTVVVLLPA